METIAIYIALALVSFIQNMAFTFTSRSRNSGDPSYHRKAAWGSNGIWLVNQIFLVKIIWEPVMSGDWISVAIAGIIYIIFTTEGSVYMMKLMLGHHDSWLGRLFKEEGSRKVGSNKK
jgi:putative flippase GtrA